jgi:hypothetical protein
MSEKQPETVPQHVGADHADDAVVYLEGHLGSTDSPQVDLQALRRKIDRRLMPYMLCCYVLQFLDKVMLNVCHNMLRSALIVGFANAVYLSMLLLWESRKI